MGLVDLIKLWGFVILGSAIASCEGRETRRLWPILATFQVFSFGDKDYFRK